MPPTLPNLSALSLDSHATEATGVSGEQCNPTKKHKSSTRCVRMRLHPDVFAALSEHPQFDPQKYNADTTSICFLAPATLTDGRFAHQCIEDTLHLARPWITFYNHYLRNNPHERWGSGQFAYDPNTRINVNPGYYGDHGWEILPNNLRTRSWHHLIEVAKIMRPVPRREQNAYYESGQFLELCMAPDWDLKAHPTHTFWFVVALAEYNEDFPAYWTKKYNEQKEARAQAATARKRARVEGAAGPSSSSIPSPEPESEPEPEPGPVSRERINQDARAEKLRRRELAQQRLAAEARERRRRAAASPALEVRAEPVPMSPLRPVPEAPEMPSNDQADAWLRELEQAQGGASPAPAPAPELPELQELPENPSEYMDNILRDMRDNPDVYARMFS